MKYICLNELNKLQLSELKNEYKQKLIALVDDQDNIFCVVLPVKEDLVRLDITDTNEQVEARKYIKSWLNSVEVKYDIDLGIVEVGLALAGFAAAIATILTSIQEIDFILRLGLSFAIGVVAAISAYGSLQLLMQYCISRKDVLSFYEMVRLLLNPQQIGPYWFVAFAFAILLPISFLIGVVFLARP